MVTATTPLCSASVALRASPLTALRQLQIEETEVAILLCGKVASYYLKQMAQETVMPTLAGRELINQVIVSRLEMPFSSAMADQG